MGRVRPRTGSRLTLSGLEAGAAGALGEGLEASAGVRLGGDGNGGRCNEENEGHGFEHLRPHAVGRRKAGEGEGRGRQQEGQDPWVARLACMGVGVRRRST